MSVKDVLARHGIAKAIAHSIIRLAQKVILLDVTQLMVADAEGVADEAPNDDGMNVRTLTPDEVRNFAREPSNEIDGSLADRLELGYDFCIGSVIEDRLAGYCWIATHSVEARHNRSTDSAGVALSYPEEYAFRYKGFTHPDFRGRGIYRRVAHVASLEMKKKGVRYILSTAEIINYSALRSSYRCGYEYLGLCMLAGWRNTSFVWAANLSDRGIMIGKRAQTLDRDKLPRPNRQQASGQCVVDVAPTLQHHQPPVG